MGEGIVESQILDLILGGFAFGNVNHRPYIMSDCTTVILDCGNGEPCWKDFAILAPVPDFTLPCSMLENALPHRPIKIGVVAIGFEKTRLLTYSILGGITGCFRESLVNPQNFVIGVSNDNAFLRFKGSGGNPQFRLNPLALGNVHMMPETPIALSINKDWDKVPDMQSASLHEQFFTSDRLASRNDILNA